MKVSNYNILNNVDLSTTQASEPVNLYQVFMYAIQAVLTGAPVGSIKLQVSCDPNQPSPGSTTQPMPTNWTDVAASVTAISGATSTIWEDQAAPYAWVRIVYTASSGSGNASARINTRGV